jgi:hypothetical protein
MGTNFNYDDTSHQVIFDLINGGAGSGALQDASQSWQKLANEIGGPGKSFVQNAISSILTNREGTAAQAAVAAIGSMLPWIDDVAQIASTTARRTQEQADYWITAKNNIPPVPAAPKSAGFFSDPSEWAAEKMDWFPGVTSGEERAQQQQQDAAEQARQAMRMYQASSNPNVDTAPAFTAPQALDSIGSLSLTGPPIDVATTSLAMTGPAHLMAAHQPVTPRSTVHQPAINPPAATVSQLAQGGQAGTASSVTPSQQWGENSAPHQVLPPSALATSGSFDGSTPARLGPAPGGAGLSGTGRAGGVHRTAFGPRPSTELGPRPARDLYLPMDEAGGTRGGAARAGATRNAADAGYGQPFAGGAGQRSEPDRQHRSKYLLHDDSNSIVGDLPPTAPPVIGADY